MTVNTNRIDLHVTNTVVNGKTRRIVRLTGAKQIFYEFDRLMPWSPDEPFDGYVLGILLYAMRQGKPLVVHGPLSQSGMRNIEELQLIWSRWRPRTYKKIEIIPEAVVCMNLAETGAAIAAFSGGIDATFTALRNAHSTEHTRYPVSSVLMVHGFDVYLYNSEGFDDLVRRVKPLLDELQLDLRIVHTNSNFLGLQDWEDSHGLQIGACLHLFSGEFRYGLMGSSEPYEGVTIPWGSTPFTDRLMSADSFSLIHDGSGFSRTDKVEFISRHQTACRTVKVCWQGVDQSTNCGSCDKCIQTRLCFLAMGFEGTPPCFSTELELQDISNVVIKDHTYVPQLLSIINYAEAHKVTGAWISILKDRIGTWEKANGAFENSKLSD